MWVELEMHRHDEIIYTQPATDMESLAGVRLQSGILGLDMDSHRDWPLGILLGDDTQWPPGWESEEAKM